MTMALPSVPLQAGVRHLRPVRFLVGSVPVEPLVHPLALIIFLEEVQLSLEISGIPKQQMIQIFLPHGPDQSLNKRMRAGYMRHRGYSFYAQNPEIGLPAVELEKRIMVAAEPDGHALTGDGLMEHPTECCAIDGHLLDAKADDPAAKLIHDHQDPVGFEQD